MPQTAKYHYAVNGQLQTKARRFRIPLLHEDTATRPNEKEMAKRILLAV